MIHLNPVNTVVARLNNEAANSIKLGKSNKALSLLSKALIEFRFHSIYQSFPSIDTNPANDQEEQPPESYRYDEGMKTFSEPLMLDPSGVETQRYVSLVLFYNMGIAHSNRGNYDESIASFNKALTENSALLTIDKNSRSKYLSSRQIFTCLSNLGESHSCIGRFNESLTFYSRALEIAEEEYGYYSTQVSSTLNCIGVTHFHLSMNKNETSTEILGFFTHALAINQAIFKDHQDHVQARNATIMNNMGRVRFARDEYFEAMEMYEQAYRIRKAVYGEFHLDVAATLYNKGVVHELLGNMDDAIKLYQKFLDMVIFKLGEDHYDTIVVYKKLGKIFHDRQEYDKTITMYIKALEVTRENFGYDHPDFVFILNEIGDICYEQKDFNAAMKILQESLNLQWDHSNCDNLCDHILTLLVNIARISHKQGNLDKALKFYEQVLNIQRKSSARNQLDRLAMASTLTNIGIIMDQKEEYSAAAEAFEEVLVIKMKELGGNHFQVSCTLNVSNQSKINQNFLSSSNSCLTFI